MTGEDSVVILDACVLAPFSTCDIFLRLAEEPRLYLPRWSTDILDEVRRTQIGKLGWPEKLSEYWRDQVASSFPEALVEGYEGLLDECSNDSKDRHVLAAARSAKATIIVTFNLKHFPRSSVEHFAIQVSHPSEFLLQLFDSEPAQVLSRLEEIAEKREIELAEVLRRLSKSVPRFADHVAGSQGLTL
jgi:predicted nucleic acid-binding protein